MLFRKGSNMKVIDFHTHPYDCPDEFLCMYPDVFAPSLQQAKADLETTGIVHICGSVLSKTKYDGSFAYLRRLNDKALAYAEKLDGLYTPGFHIHPDFVEESCEEIERMAEKGVRLIGELVPYMHGWHYDHPGLAKILDAAEKHHMVVSYHTMKEDWPGMEAMIAEHPGLTFVAAHPGEKDQFFGHLAMMKKYPNAFLDLSGTGLFRYGILAYGVREAGAERFLFGTDYPICNPRMYVQAVLHEQLTPEQHEQVLYGNALRILPEIEHR